ncbi:hypothetical protein Syun_031456 [Stephania yunnanensis]|uniref:Leucine-rich repeat-containing N-terminal plant-type domain-containing protein n=1 Tax=Stephania yunnanensis TaxID=152371 RepID=A0AAP0DZJ9_9MAGN
MKLLEALWSIILSTFTASGSVHSRIIVLNTISQFPVPIVFLWRKSIGSSVWRSRKETLSCMITLPTSRKYCAKASKSFHGNQTDELALLAFKSQITYDPLQIFNTWNSTLHFCKWHGVTCGRKHQRVVELNLESHDLVGSLSPHISNLSFLHTINLQNNSFHGEIPPDVGLLFRLRHFEMGNNSFTGEIPSNLSCCCNLITINIGYNKLSGMVPKEIGSLQKLKTLLLLENNLTGRIPDSLGNLSSLELLRLSFNNLDGRIPIV